MRDAWHLIIDEPQCGAVNMAVDEAILTAMDSGLALTPVLRIYGWSVPTVSIGYLQDARRFGGSGLPVVRRITGGRAVLHDSEVTYSVICPSEHPLFKQGITGAYGVISGCIINALSGAGIHATLANPPRKPAALAKDACFFSPSRCEVTVGGKKLVGSAQRRFKSAFLQHGSILLSADRGLHERVFGQDAAEALMERMAWVSAYSDIDKVSFTGQLRNGFEDGLSASFRQRGLSEAEEYIKTGILASVVNAA